MLNGLRFVLLAAVSLCIFLPAHATTTAGGTTRNVDVSDGIVVTGSVPGTNGTDWETDEVYTGFSGIINWYLTWDDNNLYIGKIGGNNSEGAMLYLRADYTGASFTNLPQAYDGFQPDFTAMSGINFGGYIKDTYDEFRTWNGAAWSAANTSLNPNFDNVAGDAHFEVSIPWNDITQGNGKPDNIRAVLYQTTAGTFVYGESPWGDGAGNGGPTVGVNDGTPTSLLPQPGGNMTMNPDTPITRWWGCYPVIGGVAANGWESQQPDAGPDTAFCEVNAVDTIKMNANDPEADAVGTWNFVLASLPVGASMPAIDDVNDSATVFRNLDGYGTYEFVWSINYGMCPSTPDTIRITRGMAPDVANAGLNDSLPCGDTEYTMDGNEPSIGPSIGEWTTPFSVAPTINDPNDFDSFMEDLEEGENLFVWTITNSPACPASTDTVVLWVYANPPALAGNDTSICADTVVLAGNDPLGVQSTATGEWAQLSGPTTVVFDDSSQFNTIVRNLTGGSYEFQWTTVNGTCGPNSDMVQVDVFNEPTANAGADQDLCAVTSTTLDGNDPATTIQASATGLWTQVSGPNTPLITNSVQFNSTVTGMVAGTYVFQWKTENPPCEPDSDQVTIVISTMPTSTVGADQVVCNSALTLLDGNIPVLIQSTATGLWDFVSGPNTPGIAVPNLPNSALTGLISGSYKMDWIVSNGACPDAHDTLQIDVSSTIFVNGNTIAASCPTATDGSINITATGGLPAYTYSWSNLATSEDLTNVGAGPFGITVTDANGCTGNASFTVNASPTSPVSASAVVTNETCGGTLDGAIDLTPSGGTVPYTYAWNSGPTSEDLTGITAGNYTVTVTDNVGCTASTSETVSTLPSSVQVGGFGIFVSCPLATDGGTSVNVTGGSMPYTYNWSSGQTTEDITTGLGAGDYTITVTDAVGCTASDTLTVSISPVSSITASGTASNTSCAAASDGAVDLTLSGGTAPFTYAWSTGAIAEDISGLGAGDYTVTVTGALGCTATHSETVGSNASPVSVSATATDVSCPGLLDGALDVSVSGGAAPLTYNWDTGETTEDRSLLGSGNYTITVTDANGCTGSSSFAVGLASGTVVQLTAIISNESCGPADDGGVDITPAGGTTPYTYSWSSGPAIEDLTGLDAGTYTVTVEDVNGCVADSAFVVSSGASMMLALDSTDADCFGAATGSIDLSVSGGTAPLTYLWSNSASTEDIALLPAGTYSVTVTDANTCTATDSIAVDQPTALAVTLTSTNALCNGDTSGSAMVVAAGGTLPFTYLWTTGDTTDISINLAAATYTVTTSDANGCSVADSVAITEPSNML